jgi:hypothetical protein
MAALGGMAVWAQGRYYPYHWVVVAPFLAGLIVWAIGVLWEDNRGRFIAGVLVVAVGFLLAPSWTTNTRWSYRAHTGSLLRATLGDLPRSAYLAHFFHGPHKYSNLEQIGLDIRSRAKPGDTLCVTSFSAAPVYQVSGLRCPSRFAATHHVYDDHELGWPEEYERDLRAHRPTFILFPKEWMPRRGAFLWEVEYQIEKRWRRQVLMVRRDRAD